MRAQFCVGFGLLIATSCAGRPDGASGAEGDASVVAVAAPLSTRTQSALHLRATRQAIGVSIDPAGVALEAGALRWTMHLARWGRGDAMHGLDPSAATLVDERIHVAHAEAIDEWYASVADGIEQGFHIAERVAGQGPLRLELASGGATARLQGDEVSILDAGADARRNTRARLGGLHARDADGRDLSARFDVRAGVVSLVIDDAPARYPIDVDPTAWIDTATLSLPGHTNATGSAGAIVGDLAAVADTAVATTYVFTRSGASWNEATPALTATDGAATDEFGTSVAIAGTTIFIGAPYHSATGNSGAVYVFHPSGTAWTQSGAEMTTPLNSGGGPTYFGTSIAVDSDTLVVGAPNELFTGAVYVFTGAGTTWTQQGAPLVPTGALTNATVGSSVAISGDTLVIGAARGAYVFVRSGAAWAQQAALTVAPSIASEGYGMVAVNGDVATINSTGSGGEVSVTVFQRTGTTWTSVATLNDGTGDDTFGSGVAIIDETIFIRGQGTTADGQIGLYAKSGSTWVASGTPLPTSDFNGGFLATDGVTLLSGSFEESDASGSGLAEVFGSFAVGGACTKDSDCTTDDCVDGVCCNTPCGGACASCVVPGSVGFCTTQPAGSTPSIACGGLLCDGTDPGCASPCKSDAACAPGYTCVSSECVAVSDAGATSDAGSSETSNVSDAAASVTPTPIAAGAARTCTAASDCTSGFCVDGICCDQACTATCMTCTLPTSIGLCTPSPLGEDRAHACTGGACVSTCDGAGGCTTAIRGTECAASQCTGVSTGVGPSFCAAEGAPCDTTSATSFDCAPYACATSFGACFSTCATTNDCATGFTCDTSHTPGTCVAAPASKSSGGCAIARGAVPESSPCLDVVFLAAAIALVRRSLRRASRTV